MNPISSYIAAPNQIVQNRPQRPHTTAIMSCSPDTGRFDTPERRGFDIADGVTGGVYGFGSGAGIMCSVESWILLVRLSGQASASLDAQDERLATDDAQHQEISFANLLQLLVGSRSVSLPDFKCELDSVSK